MKRTYENVSKKLISSSNMLTCTLKSGSYLVGIGDLSSSVPIEDIEMERMLGIFWDPSAELFRFQVSINLSTLKRKSRVGPDIGTTRICQRS